MLKTFMKDRNYTYQKIAEITDYSRPYIWQVINGKRRLTYSMAVIFATIFNTSPDDIFYTEYKTNPEFKQKIDHIIKRRDKLI